MLQHELRFIGCFLVFHLLDTSLTHNPLNENADMPYNPVGLGLLSASCRYKVRVGSVGGWIYDVPEEGIAELGIRVGRMSPRCSL